MHAVPLTVTLASHASPPSIERLARGSGRIDSDCFFPVKAKKKKKLKSKEFPRRAGYSAGGAGKRVKMNDDDTNDFVCVFKS